ncbi:hypothetical protein QUF80_11900 [Desulfococcaceae bacterium HSG8]|nr:hypothetical protein [Desulfococcaceae bacterium HSG8]
MNFVRIDKSEPQRRGFINPPRAAAGVLCFLGNGPVSARFGLTNPNPAAVDLSIPREQQRGILFLGKLTRCRSVRIDKSEPAAVDLSIPREQQRGILFLGKLTRCRSVRIDKSEPTAVDLSIPREQQREPVSARFGLANPNPRGGGFVNPPRAAAGTRFCSVRIDKSEPCGGGFYFLEIPKSNPCSFACKDLRGFQNLGGLIKITWQLYEVYKQPPQVRFCRLR